MEELMQKLYELSLSDDPVGISMCLDVPTQTVKHYGVLGMKWGVRKDDYAPRYIPIGHRVYSSKDTGLMDLTKALYTLDSPSNKHQNRYTSSKAVFGRTFGGRSKNFVVHGYTVKSPLKIMSSGDTIKALDKTLNDAVAYYGKLYRKAKEKKDITNLKSVAKTIDSLDKLYKQVSATSGEENKAKLVASFMSSNNADTGSSPKKNLSSFMATILKYNTMNAGYDGIPDVNALMSNNIRDKRVMPSIIFNDKKLSVDSDVTIGLGIGVSTLLTGIPVLKTREKKINQSMKLQNFLDLNVDTRLKHYGVLGMKWGIRKDRTNAIRKKHEKIERKSVNNKWSSDYTNMKKLLSKAKYKHHMTIEDYYDLEHYVNNLVVLPYRIKRALKMEKRKYAATKSRSNFIPNVIKTAGKLAMSQVTKGVVPE